MAGYVVSDSEITSIADAIRTKGGTSAQLEWPGDFVDAIDDIPSGASNFVTGTFKGTTTGASMDVTLNYSGTGYPIAVIVYPTGGIDGNSDFKSLIQRYVIGQYSVIKRDQSLTPRYSANTTYDIADVPYMYKSSASSATTYQFSGSSNSSNAYYNGAATSSAGQRLRIRSATKMSVFIASTSYGFAANIEYTYHVIYSS